MCIRPPVFHSNFSIDALLQPSPVAPSPVNVTANRWSSSGQSTSSGGSPIHVNQSAERHAGYTVQHVPIQFGSSPSGVQSSVTGSTNAGNPLLQELVESYIPAQACRDSPWDLPEAEEEKVAKKRRLQAPVPGEFSYNFNFCPHTFRLLVLIIFWEFHRNNKIFNCSTAVRAASGAERPRTM